MGWALLWSPGVGPGWLERMLGSLLMHGLGHYQVCKRKPFKLVAYLTLYLFDPLHAMLCVSGRCIIVMLYISAHRGLLGGHVAALDLKSQGKCCDWYTDELLNKALDIGERLLPAFNTTSGIPYPKVS